MKRLTVIVLFFLLGFSGVLGVIKFSDLAKAQQATCSTSASLQLQDTVPLDGEYAIWALVKSSSSDSVASIRVMGGDCEQLASPNGDQWQWVSGTSGQRITSSLTAGQVPVSIHADSGLIQVDKILATNNLTCTPTGDGTNCLEELLTFSIRNLGNNETVNGLRTVEAVINSSPSENVNVEFYMDGVLVRADNSEPYCLVDSAGSCGQYDFDGLTVGQHTLVASATSSDQEGVQQTRIFDVRPQPTPVPVNAPSLPQLTIGLSGITEGETISGDRSIFATVPQSDSARVVFSIEGRTLETATTAPYCLVRSSQACDSWNSNDFENGIYTLRVSASEDGYQPAQTNVTFTINNQTQIVRTATTTTNSTRSNVVVGAPRQQATGITKVTVPESELKQGAKITYKVDNQTIGTATTANPSVPLDTTKYQNGNKTISATIESPGGSKSSIKGSVAIKNDAVTTTSNWFRDNIVVFLVVMLVASIALFFGLKKGLEWYRNRGLMQSHNVADSYSFVQPQELAYQQQAGIGMAAMLLFAGGIITLNVSQSQAAPGFGFIAEVESAQTGTYSINTEGSITYATLGSSSATPTPTPTPSPTPTPTPTPPPPSGAVGRWEDVTPPGTISSTGQCCNYGLMQVVHDNRNRGTFYMGSHYNGVLKTINNGDSWQRVDRRVSFEPGSPMQDGGLPNRQWSMAIDPFNSDVWTSDGYGRDGAFKSSDGGVSWQQMIPSNLGLGRSYSIAVDPYREGHVLVTFHSVKRIAESFDRGLTWRVISVPSPDRAANGTHPFFLDNSNTWLFATQDDGLWRTSDGGASWARVSPYHAQHGAAQAYKGTNGAWYFAGTQPTWSGGAILRSRDNGASWQVIYGTQPGTSKGYYVIWGDGTRLYTSASGLSFENDHQPLPYISALESDDTNWQPYNDQTVMNGPSGMAYNPFDRVMITANWRVGAYRLRL